MPGIQEILVGNKANKRRVVRYVKNPTGPELLAALKHSLTAELVALVFNDKFIIADSFSTLGSELAQALIDAGLADSKYDYSICGIRYTKSGSLCLKSQDNLENHAVLQRYLEAGLMLHDPELGPLTIKQIRERKNKLRSSQTFNLTEMDFGITCSATPNVTSSLLDLLPGSTPLQSYPDQQYEWVDFPKSTEIRKVESKTEQDSRIQRAKAQGFNTDQVFYHGTGADITSFTPPIWTTDPHLAFDYAYFRHQQQQNTGANIIPVFIRAIHTFNADLLPKTVTVGSFFSEAINQSPNHTFDKQHANTLLKTVKQGAVQEESGPHYSTHDLWHDTLSFFGKAGSKAIFDLLHLLGFDSISLTENGHHTVGVLDPKNIRSIFAQFNESESTNILSSVTTLASVTTPSLDSNSLYQSAPSLLETYLSVLSSLDQYELDSYIDLATTTPPQTPVPTPVTSKTVETIVVRGNSIIIYNNPSYQSIQTLLEKSKYKSLRGVLVNQSNIAVADANSPLVHQDLIDHYGVSRSLLDIACFYVCKPVDKVIIRVMNLRTVNNPILKLYLKGGAAVQFWDLPGEIDLSKFPKLVDKDILNSDFPQQLRLDQQDQQSLRVVQFHQQVQSPQSVEAHQQVQAKLDRIQAWGQTVPTHLSPPYQTITTLLKNSMSHELRGLVLSDTNVVFVDSQRATHYELTKSYSSIDKASIKNNIYLNLAHNNQPTLWYTSTTVLNNPYLQRLIKLGLKVGGEHKVSDYNEALTDYELESYQDLYDDSPEPTLHTADVESIARVFDEIVVRNNHIKVFNSPSYESLLTLLNSHKQLRGLVTDSKNIVLVNASDPVIHQDLIDHFGSSITSLSDCFYITQYSDPVLTINDKVVLKNSVIKRYLKQGLKIELHDFGYAVNLEEYNQFQEATARVLETMTLHGQPVNVYRNPSYDNLLKILNSAKFQSLRGIVDGDLKTSDILVGDSSSVMHQNLIENYSGNNTTPRFHIYKRGERILLDSDKDTITQNLHIQYLQKHGLKGALDELGGFGFAASVTPSPFVDDVTTSPTPLPTPVTAVTQVTSKSVEMIQTRYGTKAKIFRNMTWLSVLSLLQLAEDHELRGVELANGDIMLADASKIIHEDIVTGTSNDDPLTIPTFYIKITEDGKPYLKNSAVKLINNPIMKNYFKRGLLIRARVAGKADYLTLEQYTKLDRPTELAASTFDDTTPNPDRILTPQKESALLTVMHPEDFLKLSATESTINKMKDTVKDVPLADYKSGKHPTYNVNKYSCPWLTVDSATGKVIESDGKHRATRTLLGNSTKLPVLLHFSKHYYSVSWYDKNTDETYSIMFDSKDGADKQATDLEKNGFTEVTVSEHSDMAKVNKAPGFLHSQFSNFKLSTTSMKFKTL